MLFDEKTQNNILIGMKNAIDSEMGMAEGTLIDHSLRGAAAEFEQAYIQMGLIDQNGYAQTADREHLILRAKERGIEPLPASNAIWEAEFNIAIDTGTRFSAGELTYICTGKTDPGKYRLICEQAGIAGNEKQGELMPIEYVDGYDTGELVRLIEAARDEEKTEAFRARYISTVKTTQAFGGNRAQYRKALYGTGDVGACKIYRATGEERRIKIYFLDNLYSAPDSSLVARVQEFMDPAGQQGEGKGEAPVFHVVDIYPCERILIDVEADIQIDTGYTWDDVFAQICAGLDAYYLDLAKSWENEEQLIVRLIKINTVMAGTDGVVDVQNTSINGKQENMILKKNEIPVRGGVSCRTTS